MVAKRTWMIKGCNYGKILHKIYERVDGRENKGKGNERERFHQNIFICVMILKGDLKGFQENFETFF